MERKRIIVAYGDILGFGRWIKRPSSSFEEVKTLMEEIYVEFDRFGLMNGGQTKYLGDGIMVVKELQTGHNCCMVLEFMRSSYRFAMKIQGIIEKHWPRPEGFRIRIASGYVYKKNMACLNCVLSQNTAPGLKGEYIGYPINLAQRLLYVEPHILCICSEDVRQIIGQKKDGVILERIKSVKTNLRGVDPDDLRGLWSIKVDERKRSEIERGIVKKTKGGAKSDQGRK